MINIEEVHEPQYYGFPKIDFKFQNTGNATAFLWQFGISVVRAEVDVTPVFDFKASTPSNELCIELTNNGWGKANNVSITLNQPTLNQLYNQSDMQFKGLLESGQTLTVFRLSKDMAISSEYNTLIKSFVALRDEYSRYRNEQTTQGKIINDIKVFWDCKDQNSESHKGEDSIWLRWANVALTTEGFTTIHHPPPRACIMESDILTKD
jgi:hypothetical protein